MGAEKRKSPRRRVRQPALMVDDNGGMIGACTMLDVSAGGARLKLDVEIDVPTEFILLLSRFNGSMRRRCTIAWQTEAQIGILFLDD
jgi:hypothetical protein